jgi:hypothetical protein
VRAQGRADPEIDGNIRIGTGAAGAVQGLFDVEYKDELQRDDASTLPAVNVRIAGEV